MFQIEEEMELIKQAVYASNGAHADDHPSQYLKTQEAIQIIKEALQRALNTNKGE